MGDIGTILAGAVTMASCIAALFFLRFWRQTRDGFFLYFAAAFALDAATRFVLAAGDLPEETEPLAYLGRLLMFCLIIVAIVRKNRPGRGA